MTRGPGCGYKTVMTPASPFPVPVIAVIVAAGRGLRAGGGLPKQYRMLGGKPVLTRTLEAFAASPLVSRIVTAVHPDDMAHYKAASATLPSTRLGPPVPGGATRCATVARALAAIDAPDEAVVLIHDAARPFVSLALIEAAVTTALLHGSAIPALDVTDTVKRIDADGRIVSTLDRASLRTVQTPQGFRLGAIRAAHAKASAAGRDDFTDDAAVLEWAGVEPATFAGDPANIKLTRSEDFMSAERRLSPTPRSLRTRVATGYDVHAFGPGDHVWLGGVRIAHDRGVVAHSDGDVALHALCDALFGAIGDGDIGVHFPPSDERWRGASSDRFLAFACERVAARGGVIDHVDLSIICERPKVGPHRDAMRARIAEVAGISTDQVGLKATTSERLGFIGRAEGLAALATVTLRLPEDGPDER